jgi:hypothetical protein
VPVLASQQRRILEDACAKGRRTAEQAVRAALTSLAVTADRPPAHLNEDERQLRRGLRAKSRQLGDTGTNLDLLVADCAYEQWHRLLFARFLAENNLLIHPDYNAPVTLDDCEELAEALGEPDGWSVAARFAAEILPGIFRLDDPCFRVRLAPEGRLSLEGILASLPEEVFAADDALGWVYQFWQRDKKDEVNASERKIGGADLAPVTQLFTENYMVRFLLENSLGAWWAARHPDSPLVMSFEYLRFTDDNQPEAGTYEQWPERAAEVTVMDPCCGSGHFLVEAFSLLWQMRGEEESLAPADAQDAVLRDNLFGLELDPRCVQIAMFAVALQAWKAGGGWRPLPVANIACSGIPVKAPVEEWKALARGDDRLENALVRLHNLFRDADTLGSLIDPRLATEISDPRGLQRSFADVDWTAISPIFARASDVESMDPATVVLGAGATAISRAVAMLDRKFTLLLTNPPFLSEKKQGDVLLRHLQSVAPDASADLATAFLSLLLGRAASGGHVAMVTPQNWHFQGAYTGLRRRLLRDTSWALVARLGTKAFSAGSTWDFHTMLVIHEKRSPDPQSTFAAIDVSALPYDKKADALVQLPLSTVQQAQQTANPDARIVLAVGGSELPLLEDYAVGRQGIKTGDDGRFRRRFWEQPLPNSTWAYFQTSFPATTPFAGRTDVVLWESGTGAMAHSSGARIVGKDAWERRGVMVSQMGDLPASLYEGDLFDTNASPLVPKSPRDLAAIWHFCSSNEYHLRVREIDTALKVTNRTLAKVPFDIGHWRRVADEAGPLPEPWSDDPTQWLFDGRPDVSTARLHVAVARLVGFRWPEHAESDGLDAFADDDGIVCLPSVAGEAPAADRLQQVLAAAFDETWSPTKLQELIEQTGSKKRNVADWLRDEFFKQHCALFGNRPFVWHIWDGRRDGFAALLNYHRLDRKTLEKLTYTYLGDWIERQRAGVRDEKAGAEARLAAASELRRSLGLILEGEPPLDIYVRWKSLAEQPIGWDPDVNDGVRLNVRPFVEAGVLRSSFNIHWRTDRGKNPDGSVRLNDLHFTSADKRAARGEQK